MINSLLMPESMIRIMTKIIKNEFYNDKNIYQNILVSIIKKVNDINFDIASIITRDMNKESIHNIIYIDDYLTTFIEKKRNAKEKLLINVKNKEIREGKESIWTIEDKMKSFAINGIVLQKGICILICKVIFNSKKNTQDLDKNILGHLFLKICSYVFKDDDFFLKQEVLNFEYDKIAFAYFMSMKAFIDKCSDNYKIKVEVNKERKMKKFKG